MIISNTKEVNVNFTAERLEQQIGQAAAHDEKVTAVGQTIIRRLQAVLEAHIEMVGEPVANRTYLIREASSLIREQAGHRISLGVAKEVLRLLEEQEPSFEAMIQVLQGSSLQEYFKLSLQILEATDPEEKKALRQMQKKIYTPPIQAELRSVVHSAAILGTTEKKVAGMIGLNPMALQKLSQEGNIRECFTAAFNSLRYVADVFKEGSVVARINERLTDFQIRADLIQTYQQESGKLFGLRKERDRLHAPLEQIRVKRKIPVPGVTLKQINEIAPLSAREERVIRLDKYLPWETGRQVWEIPQEKPFAQEAQALGLPIIAGPSGTTDRLFELASYLGMLNTQQEREVFRLACIGYLLPMEAHSVHEVMLAAVPYGMPYTPSSDLSQQLLPHG